MGKQIELFQKDAAEIENHLINLNGYDVIFDQITQATTECKQIESGIEVSIQKINTSNEKLKQNKELQEDYQQKLQDQQSVQVSLERN